MLEQFGGLVDLAEAVQLVAEDVEQEAVARRDPVDEVHGVGLVQFQHRDVRRRAGPASPTSPSSAAATPRVKLLPVRLVKTFRPWLSSSSTTIFVVVVLPFVPLTTATPSGRVDSVRGMKPGSFFYHQPGKGRASAPEPGYRLHGLSGNGRKEVSHE